MMVLLYIVLIIAVIILPVKIAATYVGAGRTGAISCLIAVIIGGGVQRGLQAIISNGVLQFLAALLCVPVVYMLVLDTTYRKGFIISIVQIVLVVVFALILFALYPGRVSVSS